MAATLEAQLRKIEQERTKILTKIKKREKQKTIQCASCDHEHKIGELTAIQTHWYVKPEGCSGGDYWNEGELQYICPETKTRNRLLFDNTDVPYENRYDYEHNAQAQFKNKYKHLFAQVIPEHEEQTPRPFVNNYYVDDNRKKFGLVERKEPRKPLRINLPSKEQVYKAMKARSEQLK